MVNLVVYSKNKGGYHCKGSVPNVLRQEFIFHEVTWRDTGITYPNKDMVENGHLKIKRSPRLGADLVEEEIETPRVYYNPYKGFMYNN